ncbi:MAG: PrsW family intramembrane metalloprotease [Synergistaceae bacterium]|nr:PrsW family intramembrane metalloprotease [Synergistaceae bacterium]
MGVLVALGMAPGLALLWWFYNRDYLDPEPLSLVFSAFLRGMVVIIPVGLVEKALQPLLIGTGLLYPFLGIALVEEWAKWVVLKRFIDHPACDECYDGIVYGTAVSLGFATLENVIYLAVALNPWAVAGLRAFLPVPLHALCGLFMGYEAARQKMTGEPSRPVPILFLPVLAHGAFNLALMSGREWGIPFALVLLLLLWMGAFRKMKDSRQCR